VFKEEFYVNQVQLRQNFSRKGVTGSGLGRTLLHKYISQRMLLPVQLLLEKGMDPNARDNDDYTPLHLAIIGVLAAQFEIVNSLLQKGASVNEVTSRGMTPLMLACMRAEPTVVKLFVDGGAEVGLKNNNGETAWDYAKRATYMHMNEKQAKQVKQILKKAGGKSGTFPWLNRVRKRAG